MAEAEDVLLSAAERMASATRRLWAKHGATDPSDRAPPGALLRIDRWLVACFGRSWPLVVFDHPSHAGWLRRALKRPAPWQVDPQPVAATDGAALFVPRDALGTESSPDLERALLAALALGRRCAGGFQPDEQPSALGRDVRWALEAARGDAALAELLPGLAALLNACRSAALAMRPPLAQLRPVERVVEELVRALLRGPANAAEQTVSEQLGAQNATAIDDFARALTSRHRGGARAYRGMSPVGHWGVPWPLTLDALGAGRPDSGDAGRAASRPTEVHRLPRSVRRRPLREDPARRPGPFLVPPSDPHLAVEDASGIDRPDDRGDEDLDALATEIARFEELATIRSERVVREILERGDCAPRTVEPEATRDRVDARYYPEWDFQHSAYRDPGVSLREAPVPESDAAWVARLQQRHGPMLAALRRQFEALRPRLERLSRQVEGDEIDLDAWVGEHAERLSGRSTDGRLYRVGRPRRRDLAVALLVDASGSTDSWISRDTRVIDVAKEAALSLSEALSAVGDTHAIYAFSGRGAGDVRVWVAKRFAERLDAASRARIGGLQPDRSTRLGGPIRHVTAALTRVPAQVRILLVLSDGKPNDDDAYEGEYGVEDVRRAVQEASRIGVRSFCVTIDRRGSTYLPRLFGPSGYTLLWDAAQLPQRLPVIYRHLTRSLRS